MYVFWFLVILALAFIWVVFSFVYKPIGKLAHRIWREAKENMGLDESKSTDTNTNQ